MPTLFLPTRYDNFFAALLDDPRLSVYQSSFLENLLNAPIEFLHQYLALNDDASLFDIISSIIKVAACCSEIVDQIVYEKRTDTIFFRMACPPFDVTADTTDDDEILATTPDEVIVDTTDVTNTSTTTTYDAAPFIGLAVYERTIETNSFIMECIPETIDFEEDTYDDDASNLTQHQQQRKDASDIGLANPSTILPVTRMTHHKNDRIKIIDDDEKSADNGVPCSVSQHNQRKFVSDVNDWPQSFLPDTTSPTSPTIPSTNYVPSRDFFDCITPSMHTLNVHFNLYPAAVQPQLHDDTPVFDSPENAAVPPTIIVDPVTADNDTKVLLANEQSPLADQPDNPAQNSDHNIYCDDYEHEHDHYYGSINHHSNGNLTKYEHDNEDYDDYTTLTKYYDEDDYYYYDDNGNSVDKSYHEDDHYYHSDNGDSVDISV